MKARGFVARAGSDAEEEILTGWTTRRLAAWDTGVTAVADTPVGGGNFLATGGGVPGSHFTSTSPTPSAG
jgi:hypothetical protein